MLRTCRRRLPSPTGTPRHTILPKPRAPRPTAPPPAPAGAAAKGGVPLLCWCNRRAVRPRPPGSAEAAPQTRTGSTARRCTGTRAPAIARARPARGAAREGQQLRPFPQQQAGPAGAGQRPHLGQYPQRQELGQQAVPERLPLLHRARARRPCPPSEPLLLALCTPRATALRSSAFKPWAGSRSRLILLTSGSS